MAQGTGGQVRPSPSSESRSHAVRNATFQQPPVYTA